LSILLTVNGSNYSFPEPTDIDWGQPVTDWATAITNGLLQKAGGTFTLTAEVDFGATYGLKSAYYKSRTANIADSGQLRLARTDLINFRNEANSANLSLGVNSSDQLTFNGTAVQNTLAVTDTSTIDLTLAADTLSADIVADSITNSMINTAAGIVYSKLNLADSIVNADINSAAAIAYSKLNLSNSIVNADVSSSAAIAGSKIAPQFGNQLVSGDREFQFTEISTPSAPTSNKVLLYPKADGNFYKMDDTGAEVQVGSGGSGSGSLNIVDNPSAISNTTGWTAATNYTVSRDTSNSPLAGVIDSCFAISTTTASSESSTSGVYAASLANPSALRNTKLQLSMYLTVPATSDGVWVVSVYNSGGTRVALSTDSSSVTTLPGGFTGQFAASFDADAGATYTISITQTTRTNANTLYATNISIGNEAVLQGAIVGPWLSYTPVTAGFGTVASVDVRYRRVGSSIEVQGQFTAGTVTSSEAQIGLPTGLTITGPSGAIVVGKFDSDGVQSDNNHNVLATAGDTFVNVARHNMQSTATNMLLPAAGNVFATNSTRAAFFFSAPIAEWAGSGTVNLASNGVEFASSNGTWDAATTVATTVYGPAGAIMGGALTASRAKVIRFSTPIQVTDYLTLEIQRATGEWVPAATLNPYSNQNSVEYGVTLTGVSGNDTDVTVTFSRYRWGGTTFGGAGTAWPSDEYWRVRKTSSGQAVGFGEATNNSNGLVKKNKYQRKNLSASNAGTVSFNNVLSGRTYRLSVHAELVTTTTANSQGFVTCNDANVAGSGQELVYFNATTANQAGVVVSSFDQLFVASVSTLTLTTGLLNGASLSNGFATLEEVNNSEVTTDFT